MTNLPIEKLIEKVGSKYKLVILAAKRALELNEGREKLVDVSPTIKFGEVALREILDDKVTYKLSDDNK